MFGYARFVPMRLRKRFVSLRHGRIIAIVSLAINVLMLMLLLSLWNDGARMHARMGCPPRRTRAWQSVLAVPFRAVMPKVCKRILLIVIFNFPYFKNVPVIRRLYGDAFARVVFYADKSDRAEGVHASPVEGGYYQQRAIAQAMGDYPDYDGYMWIGDDVLLDPYKVLQKLDPSKVWMAGWDTEHFCVENTNRSLCSHHEHWDAPEGRAAANASLRHLPERYKRRSLQVLGCTDCLAKGASDSAFIPASDVAAFRELSLLLKDVFFEFAVPTILLLLHPVGEEIPVANAYYSWSLNATKRFEEVSRMWHSGAMDFVHPVKLSNPIQRSSARAWLTQARRCSTWPRGTPCV